MKRLVLPLVILGLINSAVAAEPTLTLVSVDSEDAEAKGARAFDGDPATYWHTQWQGGAPAHPHQIIFRLDAPRRIEGISYLPRQDGNPNGSIKEYEVFLSGNGRDFTGPVKKGEWGGGGDMKYALFEPARCSHVKLVARSSINDGPFTSAAEFGVVTADTFRKVIAAAEAVTPTTEKPYTVPADPAAKKRLVNQIKSYMGLPPDMVRAHPSAADMPGVAPAGSPRVTREVDVVVPAAGKWHGWQSTGLFANAGEIVTVTPRKPLPDGVSIEVRIGCHFRDAYSEHFTTWERFPTILRTFTLAKGATQTASAFGGSIFVVVTAAEGAKGGGTIPLQFANAVEAPTFILGKTKRAEWRRNRTAPAPMGELIGNGLVLHLPSTLLRDLPDPTALMTWWDRVVAAEDELASWPARTMPERVVFERHMGGAWGLSGYPIMMSPGAAKGSCDLAGLMKDGDWGIFHEIGHNHQSDQWTFRKNPLLEQTEVTVNFFSLYVMEHIVGKPRGTGHPAVEGEELFKNLNRRFGAKPTDDAFEQLAPFVVLLHKYGWEPLKKTIASYRTSPLSEDLPEPTRQAEFVKRYSQNAGADLSGFFRKAGFSVPKKVADELRTLPAFDFAAWRREVKGN